MKVTALLALGFVLLGTGMYALWSFNTTISATPSVQKEPSGLGVVGSIEADTYPYDVLITFDANGFTPSEVAVQQGQRVRFLNSSNEDSWPAAGLHPTHALYPEKENTDCLGSSFDACTRLTNRQFFDFTFNYSGEWHYHDHLNPSKTGTIRVFPRTATKI